MKKFICLIAVFSLFFACKYKPISFYSDQKGEYFDLLVLNKKLFAVGVGWQDSTWKAKISVFDKNLHLIKNYYFLPNCVLHSITKLDDNLLITGTAFKNNKTNVYMLKINENGDTIWQKFFNYIINSEGLKTLVSPKYLFSIAMAYSKDIPPKIYLIKTDKNGNLIDEKILKRGFKITVADAAYHNGFIYLTGNLDSVQYNGDLFYAKIDTNLNIVWFKILENQLFDSGDRICFAKGFMYIIGRTQSKGKGLLDIWLLKIDPKTGEIIQETTYGDKANQWAQSVFCKGNKIYILGATTSNDKKIPYFLKLVYNTDLKLISEKVFPTEFIEVPNEAFFYKGFFYVSGYYKKNFKFEKFGLIKKLK